MQTLCLFASLALCACTASPTFRPPASAGIIISRPDSPCPTMVAPTIPLEALKKEMQGVIVVQARVVYGTVESVTVVSGPEVFHAAVIDAVRQYKCQPAVAEVVLTQTFDFRFTQSTAGPESAASSPGLTK